MTHLRQRAKAASAGQTLVSAEVAESSAESFDIAPVRTAELKRFASPIPLFEAHRKAGR